MDHMKTGERTIMLDYVYNGSLDWNTMFVAEKLDSLDAQKQELRLILPGQLL